MSRLTLIGMLALTLGCASSSRPRNNDSGASAEDVPDQAEILDDAAFEEDISGAGDVEQDSAESPDGAETEDGAGAETQEDTDEPDPVDAGPGDPCVLPAPVHAFDVGPAVLPAGGAPGAAALSIHDHVTPYASTLARVALRWTTTADGPPVALELRVFSRSGDVFKLDAVHLITADGSVEQDIVVLDPPLVIPGLSYLGLYDPSGGLRVAHSPGAGSGYLLATGADVSDTLGSLLTLTATPGTGAWRAEFVEGSPCKNGGTCTGVGDNFTCSCHPAYSGPDCGDITDACASPALNACHDLATCTSGVGTQFSCACPQGYEGDGQASGSGCSDIDECSDIGLYPCHAEASCTNTDGGAECACLEGFTGNGVVCVDFDECAGIGGNNCHSKATCNNTPGSFICECDPGWEGDGIQATGASGCLDLDECATPADAGGVDCGQGAECSNLPGSFECACVEGWVKEGLFCTDVDECLDGLDDCDENALCFNEAGSYSCQCVDGFEGDGTQCCGAPFATGDTCGDAFAICSLPFTDSRLSINAVNNYGAGIKQCNSGVQGNVGGASPDLVYALTPQFDQQVTITATGDFPLAIYVVADCGPISQCIPDCTVLGSSCVAADAADAGATALIDVLLPAGFTWYIVLDGEGSMVSLSGSYTLTVQ
ncbi:MAG: hypothetical protein ACI9WU_001401 [Myxococcota bacterium]